MRLHTVAFAIVGAALGWFIWFHRPTQELFARAYADHSQQATILIGLTLFVVWILATKSLLINNFGRPLVEPRLRLVEWYRFEAECTEPARVQSALLWSLIVGALSAGALMALLLMGK